MGMYDTFKTDPTREQEGVWLDYGDFRIRVAHAGQGNKRYVAYAEKALRPVRQAMNAGALSNERSMNIMADIYAKTIILDWQVLQDDKTWKTGIEAEDGSILPFNNESVELTLKALPNLFSDIQSQASSIANFRASEIEEEAKNS
ncbi:MAG TPA: hypothetical protein PK181_06640 [Methanothrix soehngenii]|nr:hypothetical protein [Methanothrix soehngenii]